MDKEEVYCFVVQKKTEWIKYLLTRQVIYGVFSYLIYVEFFYVSIEIYQKNLEKIKRVYFKIIYFIVNLIIKNFDYSGILLIY